MVEEGVMSIIYTVKFSPKEINVLIQAVTELRRNILTYPNSSGNDYDRVLEMEKKLTEMVDSDLDCFG